MFPRSACGGILADVSILIAETIGPTLISSLGNGSRKDVESPSFNMLVLGFSGEH